MSDLTFWLTCLLTLVILLLPVVAWRFYRVDVHPTLADKAKVKQKTEKVKIKAKPEFRPFSGRRSRYDIIQDNCYQWSPQPDLLYRDDYSHLKIVLFYTILKSGDGQTGTTCENNGHYLPWLWVGRVDQQIL